MANHGFVHFSHLICEEDIFLYMRKEYGFRTISTEQRLKLCSDREKFNQKIVIPKENGYYKLVGSQWIKVENPFSNYPETEFTAGPGEEFYLKVEWQEPTIVVPDDPDDRPGMFRNAYSRFHD